MVFQGNPNVTITAIDTSGGIACSRTSGQTPCFVQVSASAITATGTSVPYEDLEYSWDFGNPSGAEMFNQPIDSTGRKYNPISVNANSAQTGPEAAYVYRSAGTYTVTLTIRGMNGTSFTTAQVTRNITVTTFNPSAGEWYFDSAAPGGGDGSIANPFNDIATMNTKLVSNTALHLKRGSIWSGSTGLAITSAATSALRLDAYGSGASPIVDINSGSASCFQLQTGVGTPFNQSDFVFSNLTFSVSGGATSNRVVYLFASSATATMSDIYFDNTSLITSGARSTFENWQVADGGYLTSNFGVWGGNIVGPDSSPDDAIGLLGSAANWQFYVGAAFSGAGGAPNTVLDHHIYSDTQSHVLYRYLSFRSGAFRNFNIKDIFNGPSLPTLSYQDYRLVSDCDMSGTLRAYTNGDSFNDPNHTQARNTILQRNTMHDFAADAVFYSDCALSLTIRDNLIWNIVGGRMYAVSLGTLSDRIYRNLSYHNTSNPFSPFWDWTNGGPFTGGTRTFTDNVTEDTEVDARVIALVWADVQAGSTIDRNQWFAPNDADANYFFDGATGKTFAQWRIAGFDAAGVVANPNWNAPASGDFTNKLSTDLTIGIGQHKPPHIKVQHQVRGY